MALSVSGATRLAAVIGDPVRHSISPAIHNAAFHACGIDAVYVAMPVRSGDAARAIDSMRTFDWFGLSVTMPHKQDAAHACDELTDSAARLGAVNCVFRRNDGIAGDNTDGTGFVRGLEAELGVAPKGLHVAVVGAGGAAGAVVHSLAASGAARITVVNRTPDRAVAVAELGGSAGRAGSHEDLSSADVVVNATPIGMASTASAGDLPFDVEALRDDAVVSDLIYHPAETQLLAAATARGLRSQNGLAMLVYQAVTQFEHWTGVDAPVDAMMAAARAAAYPQAAGRSGD